MALIDKLFTKQNINLLQELFIQHGEIEGMDAGPRKDMAILRLGMIAELDAANFYERLSQLASNEKVKILMLDVANEEKVHIGEFEELLDEIDPKHDEMEEEGEEEVEKMFGMNKDKDPAEKIGPSEGISIKEWRAIK